MIESKIIRHSLPIFVSCCLHFKETCFQGFFKKHFVAIFISGFHQFVHFILKHPVVKSEFAIFSCTGCFIAEHLFYLELKKILKILKKKTEGEKLFRSKGLGSSRVVYFILKHTVVKSKISIISCPGIVIYRASLLSKVSEKISCEESKRIVYICRYFP